MRQKIKRLKVPRHVSCRPVLIYAKGVTTDVIEQNYFFVIIDFSELLDYSAVWY